MKPFYRLGEYEIDVLGRQLRRKGELVPLTGKPFDVLLALLERPGRVVTKDELMDAVWPDAAVEEGSLTQGIFVLRRAFGESKTKPRYFITVPGAGYQLGIIPETIATMNLSPSGKVQPSVPSSLQRHLPWLRRKSRFGSSCAPRFGPLL